MPPSLVIDVADLAGTAALGRSLGAALFPGAVIALIGPLGAGKTHLVKAIAEGLQIPSVAVVNSPTFVLIQEYEARLPIYHFDVYRLQSDAEFLDLGPEEYFRSSGVSIIEWADKVFDCLPAERLEIRIVPTGETSRRFDVYAFGERFEKLINERSPVPPSDQPRAQT